MAEPSLNAKRREVVRLWMRQLVSLHERQGTRAPAAAGWMGAIYALRAASRLDGNKEWGRLGDEIIGNLEHAYLDVLGVDGHSPIDAGRRLLETHHKPTVPMLPTPRLAARSMGAAGVSRIPPPLGSASSFAGSRPGSAPSSNVRPFTFVPTPSPVGVATSVKPPARRTDASAGRSGAGRNRRRATAGRGSGKTSKARRRG